MADSKGNNVEKVIKTVIDSSIACVCDDYEDFANRYLLICDHRRRRQRYCIEAGGFFEESSWEETSRRLEKCDKIDKKKQYPYMPDDKLPDFSKWDLNIIKKFDDELKGSKSQLEFRRRVGRSVWLSCRGDPYRFKQSKLIAIFREWKRIWISKYDVRKIRSYCSIKFDDPEKGGLVIRCDFKDIVEFAHRHLLYFDFEFKGAHYYNYGKFKERYKDYVHKQGYPQPEPNEWVDFELLNAIEYGQYCTVEHPYLHWLRITHPKLVELTWELLERIEFKAHMDAVLNYFEYKPLNLVVDETPPDDLTREGIEPNPGPKSFEYHYKVHHDILHDPALRDYLSWYENGILTQEQTEEAIKTSLPQCIGVNFEPHCYILSFDIDGHLVDLMIDLMFKPKNKDSQQCVEAQMLRWSVEDEQTHEIKDVGLCGDMSMTPFLEHCAQDPSFKSFIVVQYSVHIIRSDKPDYTPFNIVRYKGTNLWVRENVNLNEPIVRAQVNDGDNEPQGSAASSMKQKVSDSLEAAGAAVGTGFTSKVKESLKKTSEYAAEKLKEFSDIFGNNDQDFTVMGTILDLFPTVAVMITSGFDVSVFWPTLLPVLRAVWSFGTDLAKSAGRYICAFFKKMFEGKVEAQGWKEHFDTLKEITIDKFASAKESLDCWIGAALTAAMVACKSLGVVLPYVAIFQGCAMFVTNFVRLIDGVPKIWHFLSYIVRGIFNFIYRLIYKRNYPNSDADIREKVDKFIAEMVDLYSPDNHQKLMHNQDLQKRLIKLHYLSFEIMPQVYQIGDRELIQTFSHVLTSFRECYRTFLQQAITVGENIPEPISALLHGKPGCGKSMLATQLFKDLGVLEGRDPKDFGKYVYSKVNTMQTDLYYTGYNPSLHLIFYLDDYGQLKDVEGAPSIDAGMMIHLMGSMAYVLESAHLHDKGKIQYNSPYIVGTSNQGYINTVSFLSKEAINRRWKYVVHVEPKPQYAKMIQGRDRFDPTLPTIDVTKEFPLILMLEEYDAENGVVLSKREITYGDLVRWLKKSRDESLETFKRREQQGPILGSVGAETMSDGTKSEYMTIVEQKLQKTTDEVGRLTPFQHAFQIYITDHKKNIAVLSDADYCRNCIRFTDFVAHPNKEKWCDWIVENAEASDLNLIYDNDECAMDHAYIYLTTKSMALELYPIFDEFFTKKEFIPEKKTLLFHKGWFAKLKLYVRKFKDAIINLFVDDKQFKLLYRPALMLQIGGGLLLCGYAFYSIYKIFKQTVPQSRDDSKGEHRRHREVITHIPKVDVKTGVVKQSLDPNINDIERVIMKNQVLICVERQGESLLPIGNSLIIIDRIYAMPTHYKSVLKNYNIVHFYRMGSGNALYACPSSSIKYIDLPNQIGEGDSDITLMVMKYGPQGASILKHIMCDKDLSHFEHVFATLNVLAWEPSSKTFVVYCERNISVNVLAEIPAYYGVDDNVKISVRQAYQYIANTRVGDCGAPLIATNKGLPRTILGLHVAGNGTIGYAQVLTQEMIMRAIEPVKAQYKIEFEPYKDVINMEHLVITHVADNTYKVEDKLEMPGPVMGQVRRCHSVERTRLEESPLHGKLEVPSHKKPAILKTIRYDNIVVDVAKKALMKMAGPFVWMDPKIMKESIQHVYARFYEDYDGKLKSRRRVLTLEEAVFGVDGDRWIPSINTATSVGWSLEILKPKGTKGKQGFVNLKERFIAKIVREKCEYIVQQALKGKRCNHPFKDLLKDELRLNEKATEELYEKISTRIFSGCDLDFCLVFRRYFSGFLAHVMAGHIYNGVSVGIDPHTEWKLLSAYMTKFSNRFIDGDFERFDGSLFAMLLDLQIHEINKWYGGSEEDNLVRIVLWRSIVYALHVFRDVLWMATHSNPSGNPATAGLNSISVLIIFLLCWKIITLHTEFLGSSALFDKNVVVQANGDDNLTNVSEAAAEVFTPATIALACETLGMRYTTADKTSSAASASFKPLHECTYLSRQFSKKPKMFGKLKEEIIWTMVQWQRAGVDTRSNWRCTLQFALMEMSYHGRKKYKYFADQVRSQIRALGYPWDIPTYDEQVRCRTMSIYGGTPYLLRDDLRTNVVLDEWFDTNPDEDLSQLA